MKKTSFLLLILSVAALSTQIYAKEPQPLETLEKCYQRTSPSAHGTREKIVLHIKHISKQSAEFNLQAEFNPSDQADGYNTRNAVIENGRIAIFGNQGHYRSNNEADETLGHCEINFSFNGGEIHLMQSGKCWWFGEGIDVTGKYSGTCK